MPTRKKKSIGKVIADKFAQLKVDANDASNTVRIAPFTEVSPYTTILNIARLIETPSNNEFILFADDTDEEVQDWEPEEAHRPAYLQPRFSPSSAVSDNTAIANGDSLSTPSSSVVERLNNAYDAEVTRRQAALVEAQRVRVERDRAHREAEVIRRQREQSHHVLPYQDQMLKEMLDYSTRIIRVAEDYDRNDEERDKAFQWAVALSTRLRELDKHLRYRETIPKRWDPNEPYYE